MNRLPAWIGWPGTDPAPGHDWLPGPKLRFVILGLTYAFLAFALTVNYAYSTAFFLLAIIGLYVGLRRGFVNGLTRMERLVMLAFAAYVGVSIASFLLGEQTRIGFRFIGRDLRFLLFIPVYLAIRWARPKARHLVWVLAGGALGDCIMALIQHQPWPAPTPHGVAGTHITFGDLSILSGFLAAALLIPHGNGKAMGKTPYWSAWGGALLALIAGVVASGLAGARGGWLAIPVLLLLFLWLPPIGSRLRGSHRLVLLAGGLVLLVAGAWSTPVIHRQINRARLNLTAYLTVANTKTINAPCVDSKSFLRVLLGNSHVKGPGRVRIERLPQADRKAVQVFGCTGDYALRLSHTEGTKQPFQLSLYRGNDAFAPLHRQSGALLVNNRGEASLNIGWKKPWIIVEKNQGWQYFRVSHTEKGTQWINVFLTRGRLRLIPFQIPHGYFAYALAKSSVGERLEMWRAAWALFLQHPWLGGGTGAFHPLGEEALSTSAMVSIVGGYEHAHSDYLTSLGTKGIVGFLSLIIVLASPWLALRCGKDAWPLAGAVFTGGMAACALTETLFVHSLVLSWFAVVTAALLAAAMAEELPRG